MRTHSLQIRENFSKSAKLYDEISSLQQEIADELLTRLHDVPAASHVLDIGMGTGYLLKMLHLRYPDVVLFGLDYALGMLQEAAQKNRAARVLQADANALPFADRCFDVVVSNVAYQWVDDLGSAFAEVKRVLKDKGKFCFTVFSEHTLCELKDLIIQFVWNDDLEPFAGLPNSIAIEQALKNLGFCDIAIEHSRNRSYYEQLQELLVWLKLVGANRYWPKHFHRGLSGRKFITTLGNEYTKRFSEDGKIFATFEVLYVSAVKAQ